MRARGAILLAAACVVASSLAAGAITGQALQTTASTHITLAYSQRTFSSTRIVKTPDFVLHSVRFRSMGGPVEVDWYDSALASVGSTAGSYVTLYIDGRAVLSTLRGGNRPYDEIAPATLRWAGPLSSGPHELTVQADRVDFGFAIPYVEPGFRGVDSVTVTQYSAT